MTRFGLLVPVLLPAVLVFSHPHAKTAFSEETASPPIGQSENVYTLASENTEIRGLAFDETTPKAPRLFVLDRSGKVFAYRPCRSLENEDENGADALELLSGHVVSTGNVSKGAGRLPLASPRGLAFAIEDGHEVFYVLNWEASGGITSRLWRFDATDNTSTSVDLSLYPLRIGDREVLDLALDRDELLVSFDASGYTDHNLRVRRGVVRLKWNHPTDKKSDKKSDKKLEFVQHLPDAGTFPSYGLAYMELEGARYFWATIGGDHIYCADARTGRGLFHFDRSKSAETSDSRRGLCFGDGYLWVPAAAPGADRVHCVNVTKNLDAAREGPKIVRHLVMTLRTEPEEPTKNSDDPGTVHHYYSRPYPRETLPNQGIWPETEKIVDVSGVPNATVIRFNHDPAGDIQSRQQMRGVEYAAVPASSARNYSSRYEIDLWTNPYRKFVYPHRVTANAGALRGTDYLADDPDLFNLADTKTYEAFWKRVKTHIEEKYDTPADMKNPYWAARNALEYIQDNYYYPNRSKQKPAAVDYARKHYDANPGNLKIELSDRPYDKSQIIACSGTSVMLAGAMRYVGFPARWLGTGTQQDAGTWDTNGNGLLDADETAPCTNGHRYTQVWLGPHYGWICFDATPSKPEFNDYDPPPPLQPQWRYMNRAAAGHLKEKRIVFNVGSTLFRPLYREFEYDKALAIDNNCGGDQRYNLQGRFEKPELWKLARSGIAVKNLCFVTDVTVSGPRDKTKITWNIEGPWCKDPTARLSVTLQRMEPDSKKSQDVALLVKTLAHDARSTHVDLSDYHGKRYRIMLRKIGDPETGGYSEPFDLE